MTSNDEHEHKKFDPSFARDWGYPHEIRATIHGAGLFDVREIPGSKFKSGRQKFVCTFLNEDRTRILEKREAMMLHNKNGEPYFVARRHRDWRAAAAAAAVDDIMKR